MVRALAMLAGLFLLVPAASAAPVQGMWKRLVITEVMVLPLGVDMGVGQWIEVRNPGEDPVNLQGLVLQTSSKQHVLSVAKELILEPGAYIVLGRSSDPALNGGLEVGYSYAGDLLLDPESDTVMLQPQGGELIDAVSYGPAADLLVQQGATLSLEPRPAGAAGSDVWCHGRTPYGDLGNKGTPGGANTWCDGDGDGAAEDEGDCDDGEAAVHPGATEVCNGRDDDCDGVADDDPVGAPACRSGGVCTGASPACKGAGGFKCTYPATFEAVEQTCDGLDNDCDGFTDEDLSPPAGLCASVGVCEGSSPVCGGVDGWGCTYPSEYEEEEATCDGRDNDCDGKTDESFDVGAPCTRGIGACARTGVRVCSADGKTSPCSATAASPTPERCDGLDNDCDDLTDEDYVTDTRRPGAVCTTGAGACVAAGKWRCSEDGAALVCAASPGRPSTEACDDGVDNDCDGWTDEEDCLHVGPASSGCRSRGTGPVGAPAVMILLIVIALLAVAFRPASRTATGGRARSRRAR